MEEPSEEGSDEEGDSRSEKITRVISLMRSYFDETDLPEEDISSLIEECYRECDQVVGEEAAVEWSKDDKGETFKLCREICQNLSQKQKH